MSTSDRVALVAISLAILLVPTGMALLQQGDQRQPVAQAQAYATAPAPTATPLRSRTPRPTLGPTRGPRATVFVLEWPTPNMWAHQPPAGLVAAQIERGQR